MVKLALARRHNVGAISAQPQNALNGVGGREPRRAFVGVEPSELVVSMTDGVDVGMVTVHQIDGSLGSARGTAASWLSQTPC